MGFENRMKQIRTEMEETKHRRKAGKPKDMFIETMKYCNEHLYDGGTTGLKAWVGYVLSENRKSEEDYREYLEEAESVLEQINEYKEDSWNEAILETDVVPYRLPVEEDMLILFSFLEPEVVEVFKNCKDITEKRKRTKRLQEFFNYLVYCGLSNSLPEPIPDNDSLQKSVNFISERIPTHLRGDRQRDRINMALSIGYMHYARNLKKFLASKLKRLNKAIKADGKKSIPRKHVLDYTRETPEYFKALKYMLRTDKGKIMDNPAHALGAIVSLDAFIGTKLFLSGQIEFKCEHEGPHKPCLENLALIDIDIDKDGREIEFNYFIKDIEEVARELLGESVPLFNYILRFKAQGIPDKMRPKGPESKEEFRDDYSRLVSKRIAELLDLEEFFD